MTSARPDRSSGIVLLHEAHALGSEERSTLRMAAALVAAGRRVRLWIPDGSALAERAPAGVETRVHARFDGGTWVDAAAAELTSDPADAVVATMRGNVPPAVVLSLVCARLRHPPPVWLKADLPPIPGTSGSHYGVGAHEAIAGVLAVSDATRDAIAAAFPTLSQGFVRTFRAAVDLAPHDLAGKRGRLRSALGLDAATPLVGTLCPAAASSGIDLLISALASLRQSWPEARAVVCGEGSARARAELEAAAEAAGVREALLLLSPLEDPCAFFADLDVYVQPSRVEGLSSALIEALCAGVPAVASDVGGTREIIGPATGWLVAPEDPAALADAMAAVLGDRESARARAEQGRAAVEREHAVVARAAALATLCPARAAFPSLGAIETSSLHRVLVSQREGAGDTFAAWPLLRVLRELAPQADVTFRFPPGRSALLRGLPAVQLAPDDGPLPTADEPWDLVLDITRAAKPRTGPFPPAHRFAAFAGEGLPAEAVSVPIVWEGRPLFRQYLDLLAAALGRVIATPRWEPWPIAPTPEEEALAESLLAGVPRPYAVIAPGGFMTVAKHWDPARFARAADFVARVTGCGSVLAAHLSEAHVCGAVRAKMQSPVRSLAGATGWSVQALIVRGAAVVIANDNGVLHLADALGVPCVAVFGVTCPVTYGTLGPRSRTIWEPQRTMDAVGWERVAVAATELVLDARQAERRTW